MKFARSLVMVVIVAMVGGGSYAAGYLQGAQINPPSIATAPATDALISNNPEQFKLLWEVWNLVQKEYYNPAVLDPTKMTYGAIRGMLGSLEDAHTGFASPDLSRVSQEDMKGTFFGIGVNVESRDGLATVVSPIEGSPGEAAGIKPGDVIYKVDGRDVTSLSLMETVALIRGPKDTMVEVTMLRQGEPEPLVFTIKRTEIKPAIVTSKMLESNIGYVKITSFAEPTAGMLASELKSLMAQNPSGLVLDLRNNPGGLLDAGVDVASQFMADGIVLHQKSGAQTVEHKVKPGGLATEIPMAVVINRGSASASEIVAGALQDTGRAKLVGEPSFGKDTVQNVHTLSDGSTVRITISQWLTPNKQDIHESGLKPDLLISNAGFQPDEDPQLDKAVELLTQP